MQKLKVCIWAEKLKNNSFKLSFISYQANAKINFTPWKFQRFPFLNTNSWLTLVDYLTRNFAGSKYKTIRFSLHFCQPSKVGIRGWTTYCSIEWIGQSYAYSPKDLQQNSLIFFKKNLCLRYWTYSNFRWIGWWLYF